MPYMKKRVSQELTLALQCSGNCYGTVLEITRVSGQDHDVHS